MEKSDISFGSLCQVDSVNGIDGKPNSKSCTRDAIHDASRGSPEDLAEVGACFAKWNGGSRGSSPASKKKTQAELGPLNEKNNRKRSPIVFRKSALASESHLTPTGRPKQPKCSPEEEFEVEGYVDAESRFSVDQDVSDSGLGFVTPTQFEKTKEMVDNLEHKIQKTAELIREEQKLRDENVDEYLKLAAQATRPQVSRIKAVFEKKNQKSAVNIQQLQKKLDTYQKRLREIDIYGPCLTQRQPKDVLRGMGHGLKRSVISKPKEIAHMLKNKFGSADNIKEMGDNEKVEEMEHHGSATLPPHSGLHPTPTSGVPSTLPSRDNHLGSSVGGGSSAGDKEPSEEASECSSSLSESCGGIFFPGNHSSSPSNAIMIASTEQTSMLDSVLQELGLRQEETVQIRDEIEAIKQTVTQEVFLLRQSLTEERYRLERLEEQMNDLTELHQNEMENMKLAITDMEEKVQYQSEERIRDLQELVENAQTRISRMEHQQAQQQQQFLTLEGLENGNARALIVKLINILLTVLQVLLLIVATMAGILTPLLQTRVRILTSVIISILLLLIYMHVPKIQAAWQASSNDI